MISVTSIDNNKNVSVGGTVSEDMSFVYNF